MKTRLQFWLSQIIVTGLIFMIANSCKHKEDDLTQPPTDKSTVTVGNLTYSKFLNQTGDPNAEALQAQIVNSVDNYVINFYGTFNSLNEPDVVKILSYVRPGNDTIVYYTIDPISHKLESGFSSVNGVFQPKVSKFTYIEGNDNAVQISIYDYDWTNMTGVLKFEAIYESINGVNCENIIMNGLKHPINTTYSFNEWVTAIVQSAVIVATIAEFPAVVGTIGVVAIGLVVVNGALSVICSDAGASEIVPGTNTPANNTPTNNPVPPSNNPTPNLPNSPCAGVNMNFSASMDEVGSIAIWGVAGGVPPYQYSIGTSSFQSNSIFGGPYNSGYFSIKVKDNNGCTKYKMFQLAPVETVTDYDGNIYNTITIGTQVWIVENLKVHHYNNGDIISNVTDDTQWNSLTTGAYSSYDNNSAYGSTFGELYNWYAVSDSRKIAPVGWHIPTDAEWTTLTDYLGGAGVAGGKLKEAGLGHWNSPNYGATNESGFTALAGGYRGVGFNESMTTGYWWSATESTSSNAWFRFMGSDYSQVNRLDNYKTRGFSVRCIKD